MGMMISAAAGQRVGNEMDTERGSLGWADAGWRVC